MRRERRVHQKERVIGGPIDESDRLVSEPVGRIPVSPESPNDSVVVEARSVELASARVEDARRIARGLYLDTSEIDHAARKHELMTRFEDVTPGDPGALNRAVGRAIRVTSIYGDVLFGRLEKLEDDALLVKIHSGVEGGGAQYSTTIPVSMVRELRIFEAQSVSETVLEP